MPEILLRLLAQRVPLPAQAVPVLAPDGLQQAQAVLPLRDLDVQVLHQTVVLILLHREPLRLHVLRPRTLVVPILRLAALLPLDLVAAIVRQVVLLAQAALTAHQAVLAAQAVAIVRQVALLVLVALVVLIAHQAALAALLQEAAVLVDRVDDR